MNAFPAQLRFARGSWLLGGRTQVMGIINTTPDSFSDGGTLPDAQAAIQHGMQLIAEGADALDIGGESTRPGSVPVTPAEQIRRVVPVIAGLREAGATLPISIDTQSAQVAAAALDAGADIVNDISALQHDAAITHLCATKRAAVILMHMLGTPQTMQAAPAYAGVVKEVCEFLTMCSQAALTGGIPHDHLAIDPGIGFGKTLEHNLTLLRNLPSLLALGFPLLIGHSRKAFIGAILHESHPAQRDIGTAAIVAHCASAGTHIVRVHNVEMMRQIVDITAEL